jgi:hypothetical protein
VPRALAPRRTKVTVERAQLLQRLVLLESETAERREPEGGAVDRLTEERFVVSFLKHLVWNASRRNSLYVATALGKLVHNYTTGEVQELFSTVTQDPDRVPEDSYVRAVKSKLLRDAKERYRGLVRTYSSAHGEEVFETVEPSPRLQELVRSCLQRLAPWDTDCPLPEAFDASTQILSSLRSPEGDPDAEHPIEVRRMYALIDPDCFRRLLRGLGLASSGNRLAIPKLFRTAPPPSAPGEQDSQSGKPSGRLAPPDPSDGDMAELRSVRKVQRRTWSHGRISSVLVRADGTERARFEAKPGAMARFELGGDAAVLEFSIVDDLEQIAALYLLPPRSAIGTAAETELVVDMGRRRKLGVALRWLGDAAPASARTVVEVVYRGGNRATGWSREAPATRAVGWGSPRRWAPAVVALAGLTAGSVALLTNRASEQQPPPRPAAPDESRLPDEITRGTSQEPAATPLGRVIRVQVGEVAGPGAEQVRDLIASELRAGGRFQVVATGEEAQAQLRGRLAVARSSGVWGATTTCSLDLELLDVRGAVLWSGSASASDSQTAVRRTLDDLLRRSRAAEAEER